MILSILSSLNLPSIIFILVLLKSVVSINFTSSESMYSIKKILLFIVAFSGALICIISPYSNVILSLSIDILIFIVEINIYYEIS